MRLLLRFKSLTDLKYESIGKYDIQGFVYSLLIDTPFKDYHNVQGFKFFNFSNIFPITDFTTDCEKTIIISSPNNAFIKLLNYQLKNKRRFYLNKYPFDIVKIKMFKLKANNKIISATPIVLFEDNINNKYFSFRKNGFDFFFERLKDNALKKYNSFYKDTFSLEDSLFDSFKFNKEVSIRMNMKKNSFIIIGSLWSFDKYIDTPNRKFYNFLFDCGYGEKNSLGMGFVNNRK